MAAAEPAVVYPGDTLVIPVASTLNRAERELMESGLMREMPSVRVVAVAMTQLTHAVIYRSEPRRTVR